VRLDAHLEQEVARRPAPRSRQALAAEPHPRAVGQPLRNGHADRLGLAAALQPHVGLAAVDRQPERDADLRGDVGARRGRGAPPAPRGLLATAEDVAEATGAAEQALEIDLGAARKPARPAGPGKRTAAPAAATAAGAHALEGAAVAVVHLPLARVIEHVEGRLHLLELLLCRLVVGMQVRVILAGQLAVGLADVIGARRAGNAEGLVVVVGHRGGSGSGTGGGKDFDSISPGPAHPPD
jgi:hypothetical protein